MTSEEGMRHLEPALERDAAGTFHFCCGKAFVSIRLRGTTICRRFAAKDHVAFRIDGNALTVVHPKTGLAPCEFLWEQIEMLTAGEPETDSGSLFQG